MEIGYSEEKFQSCYLKKTFYYRPKVILETELKKMKLYDFPKAPNPRRVKIFAHEKDIELELINCDMAKREHKTADFLKKIPAEKFLS